MTSSYSHHKILNCGDMKKDGNENPPISRTSIFKNATKTIIGSECDFSKSNFDDLKNQIETSLLDQTKKYCYASLIPIPEIGNEEEYENITLINKNNRQILPDSVKNSFIDAAIEPGKYLISKHFNIYETPASYIDPATRTTPTNFLPNENYEYELKNIDFVDGSKFIYTKTETTEYIQIKIILNDKNNFECSINRNGDIRDYILLLNDIRFGTGINNKYDDVVNKFFKGNYEKNYYINENKDTPNEDIKMLCTFLIFFKELGDTMQAVIIKYLIENKTINNYDSCLMTIDTVLACRSKKLNVPYLLNSNSIITYFLPINKEEYEKLIKVTELNRAINNNNLVLNEYNDFIKKITSNDSSPITIIVNGANYIMTPTIINKFKEIVNCIEHANNFLGNILEKVKNPDGRIREFVNRILLRKSYKEIIKLEFNEFRKLTTSLTAENLFIYQGKKTKLKTVNFKVFPINLIIKDRYLSWASCLDNILFKDGLLNFFARNKFRGGNKNKQVGGTIPLSIYDQINDVNLCNKLNIYSLLYPYIYCNPYLLRYIISLEDHFLVTFLDDLLNKITIDDSDLESNILSDLQIDKIYSNDLLFYLNNKEPDLDQNFEKEYSDKLLQKIHLYLPNMHDRLKPIIFPSLISQSQLLPTQNVGELTHTPQHQIPQLTIKLPDKEAMSSQEQSMQTPPEPPQTPSSQLATPEQPTTPPGNKQPRLNYLNKSPAVHTNKSSGGKKTKNKNKKSKNKKTKKRYKRLSKIIYKKKNRKNKITLKKGGNKKKKNSKKNKNKK